MKNQELVDKWQTLNIQLTDDTEIRKMANIFMMCWGETEVDLADGTKRKAVMFDVGGEQGNPCLLCYSDDENNCWQVGWEPKTEKVEERIIGKFSQQ